MNIHGFGSPTLVRNVLPARNKIIYDSKKKCFSSTPSAKLC